ncbi:MAG: hypothetical protein ACYS0F_15320, partial [Planctomycetota bacterium]
MDPPLLLAAHTLRRRALLIPILLLAGTAGAQSPGAEAEAYTNVTATRELARRLGTGIAVRRFVDRAESFLSKYP